MMLRHRYQPKLGQLEEPETHVEASFIIVEHPDNLAGDEDSHFVVPFERFGPGENPRHYEVQIDWLDIRNLIRTFIEIGHPQALHLKRTLELTRAVERSGWQNDDEPVEFWDDLLPRES